VFDAGTGIGAFGSVVVEDDETAVLEELPATAFAPVAALVVGATAPAASWSGCGALPSAPSAA
jgi:hypothetical protein